MTIKTNKNTIDSRSAPDTVGEMAAKKAGEARTADAVVNSQKLEALVLSGTDFRNLIQNFPSFAKNLENSIDTLSRKKISQLAVPLVTKGLGWLAVAAGVGVFGFIITALATWLLGWATAQILFSSLAIGILLFVVLLLINPEHRYRNLASAAGSTLIFSCVYGGLSLALTVDGLQYDLPLIDFSIHTEQKLIGFAISSIVLLLLTWLAGDLDLKLARSQKE